MVIIQWNHNEGFYFYLYHGTNIYIYIGNCLLRRWGELISFLNVEKILVLKNFQ